MNSRKPRHPVDIAVGARVKAARMSKRVSQASLAERLGLTFQQIQKYERGDNRISASKLVEIAQILSVDPAVFFKGLGARGVEDVDFSLLSSPGVMELVTAYLKLAPREQKVVLHLTQELGEQP